MRKQAARNPALRISRHSVSCASRADFTQPRRKPLRGRGHRGARCGGPTGTHRARATRCHPLRHHAGLGFRRSHRRKGRGPAFAPPRALG
eukprot:1918717-Alexandrium_andersonii.AAC.1